MAADTKEYKMFRQTAFDIKSVTVIYPKGTTVQVLWKEAGSFLVTLILQGTIPWIPITGYYVEFPDGSRHFVEPEALVPEKRSFKALEGGKSD